MKSLHKMASFSKNGQLSIMDSPTPIATSFLRRFLTDVRMEAVWFTKYKRRRGRRGYLYPLRRHIGKACFNLASRPFLTQHNGTALIEAYDVEQVLTDIDADDGDRAVAYQKRGVLLVFGALASFYHWRAGRPDHSNMRHARIWVVAAQIDHCPHIVDRNFLF